MAIAAKFDLQGRPLEALQTLLDASKNHHMEATVSLGKRLFTGQGCEPKLKEGAQILNEAAKAGSGEALTQLAVFHAIGIFTQSWTTAITLLTRAAEGHWKPAQAQLIALSENDALALSALNGQFTNSTWKKLAEDININRYITAAPKHYISESPEICTMTNFIPVRACQWITGLSEKNLVRAQVYDSHSKEDTINETRTNRCAIFELMTSDVVTFLTQQRIAKTVNTTVSKMEPISVLHYAPGEEITAHYDFIHPSSSGFHQQTSSQGQRCITFIVYLNDNYEGGETKFPKLKLSNKGKQGDAIYFINSDKGGEPDLRTLHSGCPTTSGEKWIITQFIREREVIGLSI